MPLAGPGRKGCQDCGESTGENRGFSTFTTVASWGRMEMAPEGPVNQIRVGHVRRPLRAGELRAGPASSWAEALEPGGNPHPVGGVLTLTVRIRPVTPGALRVVVELAVMDEACCGVSVSARPLLGPERA
jgi:hypothetical protein